MAIRLQSVQEARRPRRPGSRGREGGEWGLDSVETRAAAHHGHVGDPMNGRFNPGRDRGWNKHLPCKHDGEGQSGQGEENPDSRQRELTKAFLKMITEH